MTETKKEPSSFPSTAASPAAGKGMTDRSQRREEPARAGHHDTMKEGALEAGLHIPHERDQITRMTDQTDEKTSSNADPLIAQAAEDAQAGSKQDTSRALETDRSYAKLRD